jgi:hypothetical protein
MSYQQALDEAHDSGFTAGAALGSEQKAELLMALKNLVVAALLNPVRGEPLLTLDTWATGRPEEIVIPMKQAVALLNKHNEAFR